MTGTQYEGGVKYVYRDKFQATVSYFDIVQKNVLGKKMIEYIDVNGVPRREERDTTLKGLHSKGAEINFNTNISGGWQLMGGYAYTDCLNMEDREDAASQRKYEKRHYRTPRHAISVVTTYKVRNGAAKGLQFTLGVQWRDKMLAQYVMPDTQTRYEPEYIVPPFLNINAGMAYAFKIGKMRFTARLNISNVTDEMNALASYNVRVQWASPRTATFALDTSF
jgi:outer membrane receptor for ferric coprogen and ferric-rhodotorulic acid